MEHQNMYSEKMNEYWNQLSCFIPPDEKAGDEGEEDAGDQLEEAVEPHVHPVQHVVVRRQLQVNIHAEFKKVKLLVIQYTKYLESKYVIQMYPI